MGENESKATVLENMIKNLKKKKKVFRGDYGIKMSPSRLCALCEDEWLFMGVG